MQNLCVLQPLLLTQPPSLNAILLHPPSLCYHPPPSLPSFFAVTEYDLPHPSNVIAVGLAFSVFGVDWSFVTLAAAVL